MNIILWIIQILLAVHTAIGGVWKFSNSAAQTMPSLGMIPDTVWMAMGVVELLCSVALVLPIFVKRFAKFASIAAMLIAVEMLVFCGLHMASDDINKGPMVYWLVVAVVCTFISYFRFSRKS